MNPTSSNTKTKRSLVSHRHILITAFVLIVTGYILMSGPDSTGESFNPDIFSPRRIVVAPLLCLAGYLLIVVGILRKDCLPRQEKQDEGR